MDIKIRGHFLDFFFFHFFSGFNKIIVIAKMDSSQHIVLTNLIIFSYQTAVNVRKKILKKNAYTN